MIHQELSLCKNLTVYENFFVENGQAFRKQSGKWRTKARTLSSQALKKVFPANKINVDAVLGSLTIAQQQMVEIARAFCDEHAKLIILDEPTFSLPIEETEQLLRYIKDSVDRDRKSVV